MQGGNIWKIHAAGIGAVAVLAGAGYLFGLSPILAAHAKQATQVERVNELEKALEEVVREREAVAARVAEAQERADSTVVVLESRRQLNARLGAIAELAAEADLDVHAIQPREIQSNDAYDIVPIELTGRGRYPDAVAFTNALHEAFTDLSVQAFSLSGNPRSDRDGDAFSFSLAWYTESVRTSD